MFFCLKRSSICGLPILGDYIRALGAIEYRGSPKPPLYGPPSKSRLICVPK